MSDPSTPRRSKRNRDNQSSPPSKHATPSRRGTKTGTNTPVSTPTRRSARGKADAPSSQRDVSSPPSQKRKVDTSDLDPMPSSPHLGLRTEALFSSPLPPKSVLGKEVCN
ncbi:hypothetical protein LSH36_1925g00024 [Paralvinella palmiformis]|uniref:Uncharacterized protein n=1 Tax=Paralvinella palmiformis TaxID=53620 RepID=A0AAD9MPS0_9ANNE|nr:hypothetical protein LSH36_1925g00024 [Paralvinella palmiformis]